MSAQENAPSPGVAEEIEPGLRRILAPNPSPMTFWGTNTYVLGARKLAIIDPGPDLPEHRSAILKACTHGAHVTHILVTHAHLDHSPLARRLARDTGAPVLAYGPASAGRSAIMRSLAETGFARGGEGIDGDFEPDVTLADGDRIETAEWTLEALHTPGHMGNHLSFAWDDALFSGDHVMGWASSLVSPPDGDLTDFMASCAKLQARNWRIFHPGHGAPISAPAKRLAWLVAHRKQREACILSALSDGPATAETLAARIYTDAPAALLPAAARNVFAHLIDLQQKNKVTAADDIRFDSSFRRQDDAKDFFALL